MKKMKQQSGLSSAKQSSESSRSSKNGSRKKPQKKSTQQSTKRTRKVKPVQKSSIYDLDSYKMHYERLNKPINKVYKNIWTRIKHALEVLRG